MYRALKYVVLTLVIFVSNIVLLSAVDLKPIPLHMDVDKAKVALGKALFLDPILSKDHTLSCMSCHNLKTNGADIVAYTAGIEGKKGHFNAPTVYNAVFNFRQFWDGRAKDLKEQALNPIINPVEMGNTMEQVIHDLHTDIHYVSWFTKIYKDGISKENLADVLAEFEKTLITPNAPFDQYLRGNKNAISSNAKEGYRLFKVKGCVACHNGVNIGGNLFNKFGIYKDAKSASLGRYDITKREEDKYVFKVPSLRNVSKTAPYMHDGRATSLKEAVNIMSKYQLGRPMKPEELRNILSFLHTLTGELPQIVKDINVSAN